MECNRTSSLSSPIYYLQSAFLFCSVSLIFSLYGILQPNIDWRLSEQQCSLLSGCGVRNTSTTSSCRLPSTAPGPHGTLTLTIALGKQCAHVVQSQQTVRLFAASGGQHCWHAQHNQDQFRVRCAVLHSQLKSKALCINPISARAHTHRSHSQTSPLLSTSSPCITFN